ncbi:MAG: glycosyltransferase family 2 protein, partial [Hyphomicrobiaceae bacterium]
MLPLSLERDAPDYVLDVLAEHGKAFLKCLHRPTNVVRSRRAEPVVICVIKNECDRLPDFLRHYRSHGIERFFFIDNGSTDATVELLTNQPDCIVYQIKAPFDWRKKHGWITLAIDIIGRGRDQWYIYADADEHIVFDGMGGTTFGDLARQMESRGVTRVRGMLVDMYRDGPLLGSSYEPGSSLIEAYPLFDASGYKEEKYKEIISRKGGPRQRVFGTADPAFRPELTKYPLFKLSSYDIFANPHHIWPYSKNFASPCVLGILHFKFLPDTIRRIETAVKAENYWNG